MRFTSSKLSRAAMAAASVALPWLAQAQSVLPPMQTQGDVSYACGGIGSSASQAMLAARKDHRLSLLFATAGGEYMASVNLSIKDAGGAVVLSVPSTGPICLIDLKPGRYTVEAQARDKTKSQVVSVDAGSKSIDFSF
jgi:hypothetical protein